MIVLIKNKCFLNQCILLLVIKNNWEALEDYKFASSVNPFPRNGVV